MYAAGALMAFQHGQGILASLRRLDYEGSQFVHWVSTLFEPCLEEDMDLWTGAGRGRAGACTHLR